MVNEQVTTIELTAGTPSTVEFSGAYPYYWIDNRSAGDVYASLGTPEAGTDGTYTIAAGSQLRISGGAFNTKLCLLGSGKVQVIASSIASCPFKGAQGGGDYAVAGASSYTLNNTVDYPLLGLNLYGKSVQDGTPTPDAPIDIVSVGDSGSVAVQVCGKNLFDYKKLSNKVSNGVTFTNNNDGSFTVTGSKTDLSKSFSVFKDYTHAESISILATGNYTLSSSLAANPNLYGYVNLYYNGNSFYSVAATDQNGKRTFAITEEMLTYDDFRFQIGFYSPPNKDVITGTFNLQLEHGDTATDFEPYKGNIANITTALPLCGIPVSEGGNYTDGNGQQWICDELVYNADGTGKVVKRTMKIDSYNGESIATPSISTTGDLTTGATVIYQLAEPQEIELTAAEMAALRELQTYSGITNISNGSSADMDVKICTNKLLAEYVNPITTGLQKQIDELKAAVISLGGNV